MKTSKAYKKNKKIEHSFAVHASAVNDLQIKAKDTNVDTVPPTAETQVVSNTTNSSLQRVATRQEKS